MICQTCLCKTTDFYLVFIRSNRRLILLLVSSDQGFWPITSWRGVVVEARSWNISKHYPLFLKPRTVVFHLSVSLVPTACAAFHIWTSASSATNTKPWYQRATEDSITRGCKEEERRIKKRGKLWQERTSLILRRAVTECLKRTRDCSLQTPIHSEALFPRPNARHKNTPCHEAGAVER